MPLGLYVDLALGAHSGGAEVWANQAGFAPGVSCGAPPDEFNPIGQDWGLPPYSPRALRAEQYRPFIELLRANMPEGGALRIDHVAWLFRLWWVPQSASGRSQPEKGGYVHYPPQELLAVLARESRGKRCMVVGEDLGTVPTEFRQALNQAGVLSYRPLMFEKASNGQFTPPTGYPRDALTCVSTHDLPTWQGFLAGRDLRIRAELGLLADPQNHFRYRKAETRRLLRALEREGLDLSTASVHRFLARTPCKIMTVQPEDAFGVVEQANLPGTVTEHPNWRRKLPVALERWGTDPRFAAIVDVVASERGRN
jgi:4-alpha-glucanotransferase